MSDDMVQYFPFRHNDNTSATLELSEDLHEITNNEEEDEFSTSDLLFTLDNFNIMTSFIRLSVRCVLNECIDQLHILKNINCQDNTHAVNDVVKYTSIEERYMGMENHADYRINSVLTNQSKLAKDINMLIYILQETCDEIDFGGTFKVFTNAVNAIKRMHEDEMELLEIRDKNIKYIVDLRNQCEEERLYNIRTMDETNSNIQKLRFQVEDALVYGKCEVGYFENWEKARREQNDMVCDGRENVHRSIISEMENKIEVENRCHLELENYVEESKNDYLDEIQFWMKHYDEEIERREGEMITLQNEFEKLIEDHNNLKVKFQAHRDEMDDWLEFKRVRREKEEREALELWAAIKIQAWWRGTMVRKKLGPFRKKKKDKGKDKKGKKK